MKSLQLKVVIFVLVFSLLTNALLLLEVRKIQKMQTTVLHLIHEVSNVSSQGPVCHDVHQLPSGEKVSYAFLPIEEPISLPFENDSRKILNTEELVCYESSSTTEFNDLYATPSFEELFITTNEEASRELLPDKKCIGGIRSPSLECLSATKQLPNVLLEANAAYFRPTDNAFREIYSGGGIYGLEASAKVWRGLYPWLSVRYFGQSGRITGSQSRTTIHLVPIGVGLKYLFPVHDRLNVFIGAGVLPTYLHIHDKSPFFIKKVTKWGVGGTVKGGAIFNVTDLIFIDIFSDYLFVKMHFDKTDDGAIERRPANITGFSIGGGIGIRF